MAVLLPLTFFILLIIFITSNIDRTNINENTNNILRIRQKAEIVQARINARPNFIKEFGLYLSTFDVWTKIPRVELEEKFKSYEQDLPDIFELNDFLHTINCEAAYAYDYYMIVPVGTIDFEEKRKLQM